MWCILIPVTKIRSRTTWKKRWKITACRTSSKRWSFPPKRLWKFEVLGDFSDLKLTLSGATTGTLEAGKNVDEADVELSGATKLNLAVGEEVRIKSGPLENFTGEIEEIDAVKQKVRVKVKMFLGREVQIERDLSEVEKLDK